ncbi:MAG: ABC transporter permease subunit [Spirochaetales bacterium]|nr:ABC transporter permease subunit [Spirochaetales bacterium]
MADTKQFDLKQIFKIRGILQVFKKDFKTYFVSPIAYIVISIFLIIIGYLFFSTFFLKNQASMRDFFTMLPLFFCFLIPAITMQLFSEEINIGSYEILLTMPVSFIDIIIGKFLASLAFTVITILPSIVYAVTIGFLGKLDMGPTIGGYIGAIFMASAFCSIGLFASSLTRSQIVAFIIGVAICFLLWLINQIVYFIPQPFTNVVQYLGVDYHFKNISRGIIDTRDIIYFLTINFIAMYATKLVMEEKK